VAKPISWVPNRSTGSCLDPGLPRTGLEIGAGQGEGEAEAGPGLPMRGGGGQLETSRDGGNMNWDCEEPI
jgi:hypothetical protein